MSLLARPVGGRGLAVLHESAVEHKSARSLRTLARADLAESSPLHAAEDLVEEG